jgi:hypothetical protein
MPFPQHKQAAPRPEDPEALYRSLAETNRGPENLWTHQGQILASWHQDHIHDLDVAIELPTGAGKTLVGGLIADYSRRANGERTVIACPTRQLARQTADRFDEYGIPYVLLIGGVASWAKSDRAKYTRAEAVAITVYSHIFNSNPALADAEVLIFDDAHAAEQAVASTWSATITRGTPLYRDLLTPLAEALDPLVVARLSTETIDPLQRPLVYLASPTGVHAHATELETALGLAVTNSTGPGNLRYTMDALGGHVDRALIYVSHRSIQIRPLIPPTITHPAFESPRQRVYMSATLGHGGELERSFGRAKIARIPVPKGWDRRGTGRRFVVFPSLATDLKSDAAIHEWTSTLVSKAGRALLLTPAQHVADSLKAEVLPEGINTLTAEDVEDDLTVFTSEPDAALVLTNRYDGIDLPGDDCRLVILAGLPARGDMQERFLHDSLGAVEVLRERVRARFAQGTGRATRNARDYSAVVVLGDELMNYVNKKEVASALHPELQAELAWGAEESGTNTGAGLLADLDEFFAQTDAWRSAVDSIIERRQDLDVRSPAGTDALAAAAPFEVDAWAAAWAGEWTRAVEKGRRVIDSLSGGREVQRYAALWHYLMSAWVLRVDPSNTTTAADYLAKSRAAGRGTSWLDYLAAPADVDTGGTVVDRRDEADLAAIDQILETRSRMGRNGVFEPAVAEARSGLLGTDSGPYESGLVHLGLLAGARGEGGGGASAAPDAMWRFEDALWVSWEAKSEVQPDGSVGANTVREAGSHLRYMESHYGATAPLGSFGMLTTPHVRVETSAVKVAEGHLFRTHPDAVLEVFDRVVRAWRAMRAQGGAADRDRVYAIFRSEQALPSQWRALLQSEPLVPRDM